MSDHIRTTAFIRMDIDISDDNQDIETLLVDGIKGAFNEPEPPISVTGISMSFVPACSKDIRMNPSALLTNEFHRRAYMRDPYFKQSIDSLCHGCDPIELINTLTNIISGNIEED